MRNYLFRGKRTNGEWVAGDLVYYEDDMPSINVDNGDWRSNYRVDPDTIGQFTGLYDYEGRRIFYGDIVKWWGKRYVIQWDDNNACFFAERHYGVKRHPENMEMKHMYFCIVIGNVYDSPELLDEEETS